MAATSRATLADETLRKTCPCSRSQFEQRNRTDQTSRPCSQTASSTCSPKLSRSYANESPESSQLFQAPLFHLELTEQDRELREAVQDLHRQGRLQTPRPGSPLSCPKDLKARSLLHRRWASDCSDRFQVEQDDATLMKAPDIILRQCMHWVLAPSLSEDDERSRVSRVWSTPTITSQATSISLSFMCAGMRFTVN